jgi:hypothetical protein
VHCVGVTTGQRDWLVLIQKSNIGQRTSITFHPLNAGIQSSIVLGAA